jgi:hypothetical protein
MWDPWAGFALIICSVALLKYVKARTQDGGFSNQRVEDIEQRMGEVERRLGDIQDIVLSIDEKLERQERTGAAG